MKNEFKNDMNEEALVLTYKFGDIRDGYSGYIYFDRYIEVGTEITLMRGFTNVASLHLWSKRGVKKFKEELKKSK